MSSAGSVSAVSLRCVFKDEYDRNFSMLFNLADESSPVESVQAFMDACVKNKDIFGREPTVIVGAEFIYRRVTPVNVKAA